MLKQELAPLFMELKRQTETRKDLIVDSRSLNAVAEPARIVIEVPKYGGHEMTSWAHGQMSVKTNIPLTYYNRMLESNKFPLLAENINTWLHTEDKRLVRILDGKIRAILSDRYRVLDNYTMMFTALDELTRAGAEVHKADLTESHLYIKAVTPKLQGEIRPGDIIQGGIILRNSEVGASRFAVEPFVLRLKCSNGMIVSEGYSRVHLGKRKEEGEFSWSSETIDLENKAIWSAVKDVIHQTFDPASFDALVERLQENAETPVKAPTQAVDNIVTYSGLTDEVKAMILEKFLGEQDFSQWGLANGMTAAARDLTNPDLQVEIETKASDIAMMPSEAFLQIIDAKPKTKAGKTIKKIAEDPT